MKAKVARKVLRDEDYPERDGRPMAETDLHRDLMLDLIATLQHYFAHRRRVYVSGNLLVFYEEGNGQKHVSPDVFVVRGVPKHPRRNYLIWKEGKPPEFVIELTSISTRIEDLETTYNLYREIGVREYFLFDPRDEYLDPRLMGFRRLRGRFRPIKPVGGRFPSRVTGLHLVEQGQQLRLYDPQTGEILPTPAERAAREEERARQAAELARQEAERARQEAERARQEAAARALAEERARLAEAELERLRLELEQLRRRNGR
ncbi:MAG: Uma2 family endonuclease [Gemmataceae bacterium]|nr:Uma2 family endonuclease [Gemmataceae bacterium]